MCSEHGKRKSMEQATSTSVRGSGSGPWSRRKRANTYRLCLRGKRLEQCWEVLVNVPLCSHVSGMWA